MISRKLSILLILVTLLSFIQAKDVCSLQCDCSDDFSVVKCRDMEKFPVFGFAAKVKTLDLTYGNIRTIHEKELKPFKNLENLFIANNPIDCDHATTRTLKYVLRDTMKLKSFDGHKIKCPKLMPIIDKSFRGESASGHIHHGEARGGTHVHFYGRTNCMTPKMVAGVVCFTILGLIAVAGLSCVIVLLIAARKKVSGAEDPMGQMEEGTAATEPDTTAQALMEGLRKQRRVSQGFPENAIVDSEEDDVVEEEDYLKGKMKKQRRLSQGYANGAQSSDDESTMVEINLND